MIKPTDQISMVYRRVLLIDKIIYEPLNDIKNIFTFYRLNFFSNGVFWEEEI